MTAQKDQRQLIRGHGLFSLGRGPAGPVELTHRRRLLFPSPGLAAQRIQCLVPRGANQPGPRISGQTLLGPRSQRRQAGVLHGILSDRQIPGCPGEAGNRSPPMRLKFPFQHALLDQDATPTSLAAALASELPPVSTTARTSTDPLLAAGSIAAKYSA